MFNTLQTTPTSLSTAFSFIRGSGDPSLLEEETHFHSEEDPMKTHFLEVCKRRVETNWPCFHDPPLASGHLQLFVESKPWYPRVVPKMQFLAKSLHYRFRLTVLRPRRFVLPIPCWLSTCRAKYNKYFTQCYTCRKEQPLSSAPAYLLNWGQPGPLLGRNLPPLPPLSRLKWQKPYTTHHY